MTTDKIVDKIWSEHDHNKDDNFLYSDGWTDACNRFYQELKGSTLNGISHPMCYLIIMIVFCAMLKRQNPMKLWNTIKHINTFQLVRVLFSK